MILTLTVNPSIDRLARLDTEPEQDGVFRLPMAEDMAGGKKIDMFEALHCAGKKTLAPYLASDSRKFTHLLGVSGIPHEAINTTSEAHVSLTLAEPDGTTTKLNSPGMTLTKAHRRRVLEKLVYHAKRTTWVIFVDSLPPGIPRSFYVQCTETMCSIDPNIRVALDANDGPLTEVVRALPGVRPFLMELSAYELGQIIDQDGEVLEATTAEGSYLPVAQAAHVLNELNVSEALATLGEAEAVLSVKSGDCFAATSPSTVVQSTVGAGDCILAGYVISRERGDSYQGALATAAAYRMAATGLPGATTPHPKQVHPKASRLWQLGAQLFDA